MRSDTSRLHIDSIGPDGQAHGQLPPRPGTYNSVPCRVRPRTAVLENSLVVLGWLITELPYDPAIPPHGMYMPKGNENTSTNNAHARVHRSTIRDRQKVKQCRGPSTEERLNEMWRLHTTEYYSAIKRRAVLVRERSQPQRPLLGPCDAAWDVQTGQVRGDRLTVVGARGQENRRTAKGWGVWCLG